MMHLFYSLLLMTSTYFLDTEAYSVVLQLPKSNETINLTVLEDFDNKNYTKDINKTNSFYLDLSKIGFQIFKRKIAEAIETYEEILLMDPVVLKLNGTDLSSNFTSNITNVKNEKIGNNFDISEFMQDNLETNTESPLKVNITNVPYNTTGGFLETNNTKEHNKSHTSIRKDTEKVNKSFSEETLKETYDKENHTSTDKGNFTLSDVTYKAATKAANNTTSDDQKTKSPSTGFFNKVSDSFANIYHSITNWF